MNPSRRNKGTGFRRGNTVPACPRPNGGNWDRIDELSGIAGLCLALAEFGVMLAENGLQEITHAEGEG